MQGIHDRLCPPLPAAVHDQEYVGPPGHQQVQCPSLAHGGQSELPLPEQRSPRAQVCLLIYVSIHFIHLFIFIQLPNIKLYLI